MSKIKVRCAIGLLVALLVTYLGLVLFSHMDKLYLWLLNRYCYFDDTWRFLL